MTPKEKAKDLFDKGYHLSNGPSIEDAKSDARDIANLVADEFLNLMNNLIVTEGSIAYQYWQEVKKEIELL